MNIDRLFQVLVLGGAALAATGCNDDPAGTSGPGGNAGGGGNGGSDPSGPTTSSTGSNGGGGAGGSGTGAQGGEGGVSTGGGSSPLECSATPDPADACGCPCCWVENCVNTDEACCGGFCNLGNDGAGCCGL